MVKYKASFNEKGEVVLKNKDKIKRGKKSRAAGTRFEAKVRKDLEEKGWVIDKWTNNVDLEKNKLIAARRKFNPYSKILGIGTGFPDFIATRLSEKGKYEVIGIEVKIKGNLDKEEKLKAKWYLDNKIFGQIFVAKRGEKRGSIEHVDFLEKWGNKINQ
jgi:hypothetical protein